MLCCTRTFSAKHLPVCQTVSMFPGCLLTTWQRLNPNQFLLPFFPRLHLLQTGLHQAWLSDCLGQTISILLCWTTYSRPESASLLTHSPPLSQFLQSSRHVETWPRLMIIWLIFSTKQRNYHATIKSRNKTGYSESEGSEDQRDFILCTNTIFCISAQTTFLEPEIIFLLFPNIN